ncbi:protein-methionine-sulfoxide reductase heme-binding subunit MsrQ [Celeribacter arenosi]|uniref:Protein-methionine-sulfoxide reductase heme-binding subunit MsrQ n=1 Tax=Celeribacter arenosi TaxID=792649 RepID=A0ABP7JW22_9RHOB
MITDRINGALRAIPAWPLYIIALIAPAWIFYAGVTGQLGVEPIKAMEHRIGELGLQVLIATLAITPLRRFAKINAIKFRRALGLIGFFYIALHLLVWLLLDVRILSQIVGDILKRPYITIGMAGFLLLVPLAITSNNWSIRKLGPRWRSLHKLFYAAIVLGGVHFLWQAKGFQIEPVAYLGVILALLAVRLIPRKKPAAKIRVRPNRESV